MRTVLGPLMAVPETAARVGCRPPAPFGWGSRTRRRDLWHPLSLRDRSRKGSVPHARPCHPSFVGGHLEPRCQGPARHPPVRAGIGHEPKVPSVSSILDLAAERRDPRSLLRSREAPRTLVARLARLALVRGAPPTRAIPLRLGSPLGSPWKDGKDASHRLLQSTHDTSTRKSPDYRAHDLRRADPAALPLVRSEAETSNADQRSSCVAPNHLATIRPRLASRLTARDQLRPVAARCSPCSSLEERDVGAPFWVPASWERCLLR